MGEGVAVGIPPLPLVYPPGDTTNNNDGDKDFKRGSRKIEKVIFLNGINYNPSSSLCIALETDSI